MHDGVNLNIRRGERWCVMGKNGAGKSTLLKMIAGALTPDSGVVRRGTRLQIAYFDQQREQLDPDASVADSVSDGNTTVTFRGQSRAPGSPLQPCAYKEGSCPRRYQGCER